MYLLASPAPCTRSGGRRARGAGRLRQQDLRSPDMRDAVRVTEAQRPAAPGSRSPDARDYAEGRGTFSAPEVTVVKVPESPTPSTASASALDWIDVAIGAGAALGVMRRLALGGFPRRRPSATNRNESATLPAPILPAAALAGPAPSARAEPRRARRGPGRGPPGASAPRRRPRAVRPRRRGRRLPFVRGSRGAARPPHQPFAGRSTTRRQAGGSHRARPRGHPMPHRSAATGIPSRGRPRHPARAPPSRAKRRRRERPPALRGASRRPRQAWLRRTAPARARAPASPPSGERAMSMSSRSTFS